MGEVIPLMVGCPVLDRAWILESWFDHVEVALERAGYTESDVVFAFVGDPERDEATWEIIRRRAWALRFTAVDDPKPNDTRFWDYRRYERMAKLRNTLLAVVRQNRFDAASRDGELTGRFLSLDSDILVHPDQLLVLEEDNEKWGWDAIGGKVYLSRTGYRAPSWAKFGRGNTLQRRDSDGCFPVDVLMAIKLMMPPAFMVDYRADTQGEDAGWGHNAKCEGLQVGWTGRVCSKHVYERRALPVIDRRTGW